MRRATTWTGFRNPEKMASIDQILACLEKSGKGMTYEDLAQALPGIKPDSLGRAVRREFTRPDRRLHVSEYKLADYEFDKRTNPTAVFVFGHGENVKMGSVTKTLRKAAGKSRAELTAQEVQARERYNASKRAQRRSTPRVRKEEVVLAEKESKLHQIDQEIQKLVSKKIASPWQNLCTIGSAAR